jgi:hypothetical protein
VAAPTSHCFFLFTVESCGSAIDNHNLCFAGTVGVMLLLGVGKQHSHEVMLITTAAYRSLPWQVRKIYERVLYDRLQERVEQLGERLLLLGAPLLMHSVDVCTAGTAGDKALVQAFIHARGSGPDTAEQDIEDGDHGVDEVNRNRSKPRLTEVRYEFSLKIAHVYSCITVVEGPFDVKYKASYQWLRHSIESTLFLATTAHSKARCPISCGIARPCFASSGCVTLASVARHYFPRAEHGCQ